MFNIKMFKKIVLSVVSVFMLLHVVDAQAVVKPEDQYKLGLDCYFGLNGKKQSDLLAYRWTKVSAEAGFLPAEYILGRFYFEGIGTDQDQEEALSWFKKAAEKKLIHGQYFTGLCYFHGLGVEKDLEEANKWLTTTIDHGFQFACRNGAVDFASCFIDLDYENSQIQGASVEYFLGLCLLLGIDCDQDDQQSMALLLCSASRDHQAAGGVLRDISEGLRKMEVDKTEEEKAAAGEICKRHNYKAEVEKSSPNAKATAGTKRRTRKKAKVRGQDQVAIDDGFEVVVSKSAKKKAAKAVWQEKRQLSEKGSDQKRHRKYRKKINSDPSSKSLTRGNKAKR